MSHAFRTLLVASYVSLGFFALLPYSVTAETGVNADGKPYRVDEHGNEIVDYLAELEIENQSLERRISGLEDALARKESELAALGRGDSPLKERDLAGGSNEAAKDECSVRIAQASASRDRELVELRKQTEERAQVISKLSADLSSRQAAVPVVSNAGEIESKLKSCQEQVAASEREKDALRAQLDLSKLKSARIVPSTPAPRLYETSDSSSSIAEDKARARAVQTLKGRVFTQLAAVRNLLGEREARYARYKETAGDLKISLQDPVTRSGEKVGDVGERVESANSVNELMELQAKVGELSSKVREDIALIERLTKR